MTGDDANDDMQAINAVPRLRTDELLDSFAKAGPKLRELVRCEFERVSAQGRAGPRVPARIHEDKYPLPTDPRSPRKPSPAGHARR